MNPRHIVSSLTVLALLTIVVPAHAVIISVEAFDNATVQPAGPRAGASGKAFFNVEGSFNGNFASYGVADFNYGALPFPVIDILSARLELVQSNAAFSSDGTVILSLDTRSPGVDIQPGGTSPLNFDGADPGTATDAGQGDLILSTLGGGPFIYQVIANGTVNAYALVLSPADEAAIIARLNAPGPIRLTVGTGSVQVAATWAGVTNTTYPGPTLILDVEYNTGVPTTAETWGRIKSAYR